MVAMCLREDAGVRFSMKTIVWVCMEQSVALRCYYEQRIYGLVVYQVAWCLSSPQLGGASDAREPRQESVARGLAVL